MFPLRITKANRRARKTKLYRSFLAEHLERRMLLTSAGFSPHEAVGTPTAIIGDADLDGRVDIVDFTALANSFGANGDWSNRNGW